MTPPHLHHIFVLFFFLIIATFLPFAFAHPTASFPARFVHGYRPVLSPLTILFSSPSSKHSCTAAYGSSCIIGKYGLVYNLSISIFFSSNSSLLYSWSGYLNQSVGYTYIFTQVANDVTLTPVPDFEPPSNGSCLTVFANFYQEILAIEDNAGVVHMGNLPVDTFAAAQVSFKAGEDKMIVAVQGTTFDLAIKISPKSVTLLIFLPAVPNELAPTLVMLSTFPLVAPSSHPHRHAWLPITITMITVSVSGILIICVWLCWFRKKAIEYDEITAEYEENEQK